MEFWNYLGLIYIYKAIFLFVFIYNYIYKYVYIYIYIYNIYNQMDIWFLVGWLCWYGTSEYIGLTVIRFRGHEGGSLWWDFCCCSVIQSCPSLWNPMDCSTPGFPVLHHLLELAQSHVRWVGDAVQLSCPLLSRSPPSSIFPSIRVFSNEPSNQVAKV